jgi:predicted cation transporter
LETIKKALLSLVLQGEGLVLEVGKVLLQNGSRQKITLDWIRVKVPNGWQGRRSNAGSDKNCSAQ